MIKASVCFFRSFTMAEPGSMLPRTTQYHKEPDAAEKTEQSSLDALAVREPLDLLIRA